MVPNLQAGELHLVDGTEGLIELDAVLTEVAFLLHDDGVALAHCVGQGGIQVVVQGQVK